MSQALEMTMGSVHAFILGSGQLEAQRIAAWVYLNNLDDPMDSATLWEKHMLLL